MTLSLSLKNATVEQAIDRIEQETGYSFLYSNHVLDTNRLISLNASNKDINVVLSQVFDNMGVEYKIVDRQIILSRKVESAPVVQQQGRKVRGVVIGFESRTDHWCECLGERNLYWYNHGY